MYHEICNNDNMQNTNLYWGVEPNSFIKDILKYKKSGTVLDLGVGEGRNAIFLAQNGFKVTGVDSSEQDLKIFLEWALKFNLKVNTVKQAINDFEFEKKYDIVISTWTLHFLKQNEIVDIIDKIKNSTKQNGLNVISVFTKDNPRKDFPYLFDQNELKNFYKNWKVLEYQEFLTEPESHGNKGKPHKHAIAYIIAQKT